MKYDVIIIGGGAAGYFSAINIKEKRPDLSVLILEKSLKPLSKVKISGGGRCNVTHACFDPKKLVEHYPRGSKELLGPFTRFGPLETKAWFESRGVKLKAEEDGRMFPVTDNSQTIIDLFESEVKRLGVEVMLGASVKRVEPGFKVYLKDQAFEAKYLVMTTGSSGWGWEVLKELGHTIVEPVPSLFTFNCPESKLIDLPGIAVSNAHVQIIGTPFQFTGPVLTTHWGFSGPAVLKLSAFAARYLNEKGYQAEIEIDWQPNPEIKLPKRLEKCLDPEEIHSSRYRVKGKSTFKYEFTTAGGVELREVHFKSNQSKKIQGLFLAGEVLNIDGITGGFNFQNAWTGGWLISEHLASC